MAAMARYGTKLAYVSVGPSSGRQPRCTVIISIRTNALNNTHTHNTHTEKERRGRGSLEGEGLQTKKETNGFNNKLPSHKITFHTVKFVARTRSDGLLPAYGHRKKLSPLFLPNTDTQSQQGTAFINPFHSIGARDVITFYACLLGR